MERDHEQTKILLHENFLRETFANANNANYGKQNQDVSVAGTTFMQHANVRTQMQSIVLLISLHLERAWNFVSKRTPNVLYLIAMQSHGNGSCCGEVSIPWVFVEKDK